MKIFVKTPQSAVYQLSEDSALDESWIFVCMHVNYSQESDEIHYMGFDGDNSHEFSYLMCNDCPLTNEGDFMIDEDGNEEFVPKAGYWE